MALPAKRADSGAFLPMKIGIPKPALISWLLALAALTSLSVQLPADAPVSGGPGKPPGGAWMGDPIYVNSGAFGYSLPLLRLGGPLPLDYALNYRTDGSWMGLGVPMDPNSTAHFQHSIFPNVESWAADSSGAIRVYFETMRPGELLCFLGRQSSGTWSWMQQEASPVRYALTRSASGAYWLMDPASEKIYVFEPYSTANGYRILAYMDRNENRWTYSYASNSTILPGRVEDGLGRSLQFTFASTPAFELRRALTGITDQSGRTISFESTPLAYYTSATDPAGKKTSFAFDVSKYLAQVTRPLGNVPYKQVYADASLNGAVARRTATQTDAYGRVTSLGYDSASNKVSVTYPDKTTQIFRSFDNNASLQSITDASGRQTLFTQTSLLQPGGTTDRLGNRTSLTYHPESGKVLSITNANGKTTNFTYVAQSQVFSHPKVTGETVTFTFYNLSRIDYPDKTNEQFTYDSKGNCIRYQNPAGSATIFTYNSRGQVLTAQNPAGGTVTFAYNTDGTLASRGDSDTGTVANSYDNYKRPSQVGYPDGSSVRYTYDLNDRITATTDGRGNTTSYSYDDNGNLVRLTDALGKTVQYAYDQMDRVVSVTDRLGKATTFAYDSMGRLASATDPTGISTTYEYDVHGWLNRATRAQQSYRWEYDNEGSLISTILPSGAIVRKGVDPTGHSNTLTSATGGTTKLVRSEMDRVTSVTDPLNRLTRYGYDARGLLTDVTLADNSAARYERSASGWLSKITDSNSRDWLFARSPMGRLISGTDPLNQARQVRYDSLGRLNQVAYPSGDTLAVTRDMAGNAIRLLYSGGPDLSFTYDALNRVTNAGELQIVYDNESRVTTTADSGTAFGITRDDAGRIASASYANGSFSVNYTYDAATGRLIGVRDTLTQSQIQFAYDADRRLVGIARGNGVNSTLTYDGASRLTGVRDARVGSVPMIDIQATMNAAGEVASMRTTVPLDPAPLLSPQVPRFSYDAASQINSAGYRYDDRGRMVSDGSRTYTWDGASRLAGTGEATLTYNSFGDLRTRTAGAKTIRYYCNRAFAMNPIVAEQDTASLRFVRYYIWTPGGQLLYMIDAADSNRAYFYHPDRAGSILALTDVGGNVTDSYAYTPHGNLLQHRGNSSQPFTYLGYFGVRQEGESGTLYQMRARYYDAVSGRFLTRESRWPNLADPRQINPYAYALNNPVSFADITGREPAATDVYRWQVFWYEGGMAHSAFGVRSGITIPTPNGPPASPRSLSPSGVQGRWIASCGGDTQAFNKILALIASQHSNGSGGHAIATDSLLGQEWDDWYGFAALASFYEAEQHMGTPGTTDFGPSTYGNTVTYQTNTPTSNVYDLGPSTFGSFEYGLQFVPPGQVPMATIIYNVYGLASGYDYGPTSSSILFSEGVSRP
jgi:RHS repeat-associated protein